MRPRKDELPLLAAILLDLLGFGMVLPFLPLLAESFRAPGWLIGLILSSTFIAQVLVSPRWGQLSDRIGRKPVLIACTLLSALGMLVYGLATGVWMLLLSRLLAGLGGANVAVAQAMLADTHEGPDRAAAMGRASAAISLGLVLGALLGGFLVEQRGGHQTVGLVAAGFSALGMIGLVLGLPWVRPSVAREPGKKPLVLDTGLLRDLPHLRPIVLIAAIAWYSLATLEGTFSRLVVRLGHDPERLGFLFSYDNVVAFVVGVALVGALAKWFRQAPLLRGAYLFQGLGLALTPFSPGLAVLLIASTLYAVGSGVANPTVNSLCSKLTPDERQGELFGLLNGARSFGFVVGPVLGGALFDWHQSAPYITAGVVCLLAAVLVPRVPEGEEAPAEAETP